MTWEEKLMVLRALGDASLKIRKPGDWYVSQSVSVKRGGVLVGEYGNGTSPEAAVKDHWDKLAENMTGEYLVCNEHRDQRDAFKWNGFMWDRVDEGLKNEA